jgi:endonuclease/exonuclease/phosphatase family metal-dependent hydrolase
LKKITRRLWWLLPTLAVLLIVWVCNASRAGRHAEGCPQECAEAPGREGEPLRVVSLNILHGHPKFENLATRLELAAEEILHLQADIVLLQEVPWTRKLGNGAEYLAQRTSMNYLYLRANGNRWTIFFEEGEAILSRYPLSNASIAELEPRAGFFEHRVVLHAVASTSLGEIDLFVTHLTNGAEDVNYGQAESLKAFVEQTATGPAIIAGDFNATEDSPQIQLLTEDWVDAYLALNPDQTGLTCCIDDLGSGPSEPLEKRIDYIFWRPQSPPRVRWISVQRAFARPFQVAGGWQWVSDHVGLMAVLEIEP